MFVNGVESYCSPIIHNKSLFVQLPGVEIVKEFEIRLSSVQDVQEFVSAATACPFPVFVRDYHMQVNGKSFMEMFCLQLTGALFAMVECNDEQLHCLKQDIARFVL